MTNIERTMVLARTLFVVFFAIVLSACGGGGSGSASSPQSSSNKLTTNASSLSFTTAGVSQTVTLSLLDDQGQPATGSYFLKAPAFIKLSRTSGSLVGGQATFYVTAKAGGKGSISVITNDSTGENHTTIKVVSSVDGTSDGQGQGGNDSKSDLAQLMPISLTNGGSSIGAAGRPITASSPATVEVTLYQADGTTFIVGGVIHFSLSSSVGKLSQASALTGNKGNVSLTLSAGKNQGAGILTASYTDEAGNKITQKISFAVQVAATSGPSLTTPELTYAGSPIGSLDEPITKNTPARVKVVLTKGAGQSLANDLVSFSLSGPAGVGQLEPATGSVLVNGDGEAIITLRAGPNKGAATLVASYNSGTVKVTSRTAFSSSGSGKQSSLTLDLGTLDSGSSPATFGAKVIEAPTGTSVGSSASIEVDLVNTAGPNLYTDAPVLVTFSSNCVSQGSATLSQAQALTVGGVALISYKPISNKCVVDNVQASAVVNGKTLTAQTGTFSIAASPTHAITFVEASHQVMVVEGAASATGGSETSILTFQVLDANGNAVADGTKVDFVLQSSTGGIAISSATTAATDGEGKVTVAVSSGAIPTIVTVKASLHSDPNIWGAGSVRVEQGAPAQDQFFMTVDGHTVTVRAADRNKNWVPDGTSVQFSTKLGDIDPSCLIKSGSCSVNWSPHGHQMASFDAKRSSRSCFAGTTEERLQQGLPPAYLPCGVDDRYGINVISATMVGEESFNDINHNNFYDDGESGEFTDLGEAFQDYNLTGLFEGLDGGYTGDILLKDINGSGSHDVGNGKYNGLSCAPGTTTCEKSLVTLRAAVVNIVPDDQTTQLVITSTSPAFTSVNPIDWGKATLQLLSVTPEVTNIKVGSSTVFYVTTADGNNNALVGGSVSINVVSTNTSDPSRIDGPTVCSISINAVNPQTCEFHVAARNTGDTFVITALNAQGVYKTQTIQVVP